MRIAKEGYRFILPSAALALLALAMGWKWAALGLFVLALALMGFFRDPDRIPPEGEGFILSPADGKIVGIRKIAGSGIPEGSETRVSIFLSPLDVHVNRAPVSGKVEGIDYRKGRFFAAYREEASSRNERNAMRIVDPQGRRLGVVQIAGVMARRIICYVQPGDLLAQGQRVGLIMFGSRVDLFLPDRCPMEVVEGQRVRGGETVIGRLL